MSENKNENENQLINKKLDFVNEKEYEEFLALIYLCKKHLTVENIEKELPIYRTQPDFYDAATDFLDKDRYEDGSLKDKQKEFEYSKYRNSLNKPWLNLLAKIANSFHVESLNPDSSEENPTGMLYHTYREEKFYVAEYKLNKDHAKDYERIYNLLTKMKTERIALIKTLLSAKELEQLCCYILEAGKKGFSLHYEKPDQYYLAASKFGYNNELPQELNMLFLGDTLLGFRQDANVVYDKKIQYNNIYILTYKIYKTTKFLFPKLAYEKNGKKSERQIRIVTGLILSFVGLNLNGKLHIKNELEEKNTKTANNAYKNYLSDTVKEWIENAQKLNIDK